MNICSFSSGKFIVIVIAQLKQEYDILPHCWIEESSKSLGRVAIHYFYIHKNRKWLNVYNFQIISMRHKMKF